MSTSTKEASAIREQLLARKAELSARSARLDADRRRDVDPLSADAPDRAVQRENDDVVDSLDVAVTSELHAIAQALARLDMGRYGICTTCGREIGARRLQAIPYADQCQSCMAQGGS
jgi:RNA polymerase-binding transcription factor DksA